MEPSPPPLFVCPLSSVAEPGWQGFASLRCTPEPSPSLPPAPLSSHGAGEAGAPPSPLPGNSWGCCSALPRDTDPPGVTVSGDGWTPSGGCGPVGSGTSSLSVPTHAAAAGLLWRRPLPCRADRPRTHPFPARSREEGVHLEDQLISHLTGFPSEHPSLVGLGWTPHSGSRLRACWPASRPSPLHGRLCLWLFAAVWLVGRAGAIAGRAPGGAHGQRAVRRAGEDAARSPVSEPCRVLRAVCTWPI